MVVEIPRNSDDKIEVNPTAKLSQLSQNIRNGQLRYAMIALAVLLLLESRFLLLNVRKYLVPTPYNYGMFPQTLENPSHIDPWTNTPG